ncbi:C40 family peptidase [Frigoribacterium faeni]|uniref:C40 family peptidase n=1 Tax=Frigoribacterium faeni TaxID=145483 RepID=UPI001FAE3612|nr:C40 family peptidase [Frigoribacterium faeni]MCJ0702436.1 C40 family peptidase [Frigoribacterium faeni]
MSPVSEVLSRIDDIRSQLEQVRAGRASLIDATGASGSSADRAASASAFASALSATGSTLGSAGSAAAAAAALGLPGAGAGPSATGAGKAGATTASVDAVKGAVASGSGASGADVVSGAEKYLGVPYVFGGEDRSGMDCSGLVQTVFKELGVAMPRVVPDQARMGAEVGSLADARPGDLLVAKGEGHIVIYVGDGKVLHAPRPGKDVQIVNNWYSDADLSTIRRVVPATGTAGAASAGAAGVGAAGSGAAAFAGTDMTTAALQQLMRAGGAS